MLKLWLVTATLSTSPGGDGGGVWPAAAASGVCLLLDVGLPRDLYELDGR